MADKHNNMIYGMVNQIDEIIFDELKLNEKQKQIISNDLAAFGLAIRGLDECHQDTLS